ncbi:IFM5 protein, partial [Urocolius indicus]|nr:IFM5 protein [Urocolius indicus]
MDTSYPREEHGPAAPRKRDPAPTAPLPRDHLLWSIFNTVYMNFCCLGFVALAFSVKVRGWELAGDVEAAQRLSSKAKCYNGLATACSVVLPLLLAALLVTGVIHLSQLTHDPLGFLSSRFGGAGDEDE